MKSVLFLLIVCLAKGTESVPLPANPTTAQNYLNDVQKYIDSTSAAGSVKVPTLPASTGNTPTTPVSITESSTSEITTTTALPSKPVFSERLQELIAQLLIILDDLYKVTTSDYTRQLISELIYKLTGEGDDTDAVREDSETNNNSDNDDISDNTSDERANQIIKQLLDLISQPETSATYDEISQLISQLANLLTKENISGEGEDSTVSKEDQTNAIDNSTPIGTDGISGPGNNDTNGNNGTEKVEGGVNNGGTTNDQISQLISKLTILLNGPINDASCEEINQLILLLINSLIGGTVESNSDTQSGTSTGTPTNATGGTDNNQTNSNSVVISDQVKELITKIEALVNETNTTPNREELYDLIRQLITALTNENKANETTGDETGQEGNGNDKTTGKYFIFSTSSNILKYCSFTGSDSSIPPIAQLIAQLISLTNQPSDTIDDKTKEMAQQLLHIITTEDSTGTTFENGTVESLEQIQLLITQIINFLSNPIENADISHLQELLSELIKKLTTNNTSDGNNAEKDNAENTTITTTSSPTVSSDTNELSVLITVLSNLINQSDISINEQTRQLILQLIDILSNANTTNNEETTSGSGSTTIVIDIQAKELITQLLAIINQPTAIEGTSIDQLISELISNLTNSKIENNGNATDNVEDNTKTTTPTVSDPDGPTSNVDQLKLLITQLTILVNDENSSINEETKDLLLQLVDLLKNVTSNNVLVDGNLYTALNDMLAKVIVLIGQPNSNVELNALVNELIRQITNGNLENTNDADGSSGVKEEKGEPENNSSSGVTDSDISLIVTELSNFIKESSTSITDQTASLISQLIQILTNITTVGIDSHNTIDNGNDISTTTISDEIKDLLKQLILLLGQSDGHADSNINELISELIGKLTSGKDEEASSTSGDDVKNKPSEKDGESEGTSGDEKENATQTNGNDEETEDIKDNITQKTTNEEETNGENSDVKDNGNQPIGNNEGTVGISGDAKDSTTETNGNEEETKVTSGDVTQTNANDEETNGTSSDVKDNENPTIDNNEGTVGSGDVKETNGNDDETKGTSEDVKDNTTQTNTNDKETNGTSSDVKDNENPTIDYNEETVGTGGDAKDNTTKTNGNDEDTQGTIVDVKDNTTQTNTNDKETNGTSSDVKDNANPTIGNNEETVGTGGDAKDNTTKTNGNDEDTQGTIVDVQDNTTQTNTDDEETNGTSSDVKDNANQTIGNNEGTVDMSGDATNNTTQTNGDVEDRTGGSGDEKNNSTQITTSSDVPTTSSLISQLIILVTERSSSFNEETKQLLLQLIDLLKTVSNVSDDGSFNRQLDKRLTQIIAQISQLNVNTNSTYLNTLISELIKQLTNEQVGNAENDTTKSNPSTTPTGLDGTDNEISLITTQLSNLINDPNSSIDDHTSQLISQLIQILINVNVQSTEKTPTETDSSTISGNGTGVSQNITTKVNEETKELLTELINLLTQSNGNIDTSTVNNLISELIDKLISGRDGETKIVNGGAKDGTTETIGEETKGTSGDVKGDATQADGNNEKTKGASEDLKDGDPKDTNGDVNVITTQGTSKSETGIKTDTKSDYDEITALAKQLLNIISNLGLGLTPTTTKQINELLNALLAKLIDESVRLINEGGHNKPNSGTNGNVLDIETTKQFLSEIKYVATQPINLETSGRLKQLLENLLNQLNINRKDLQHQTGVVNKPTINICGILFHNHSCSCGALRETRQGPQTSLQALIDLLEVQRREREAHQAALVAAFEARQEAFRAAQEAKRREQEVRLRQLRESLEANRQEREAHRINLCLSLQTRRRECQPCRSHTRDSFGACRCAQRNKIIYSKSRNNRICNRIINNVTPSLVDLNQQILYQKQQLDSSMGMLSQLFGGLFSSIRSNSFYY
ncbi:Replicase polyprotein 1ab [Pseudolycoriella hygida]|uniref:Replicase polyprotein 1ab n=1 Tax=Pseudolycoriella hygida TaxID=35572 RepID=A0A9Q0N9X4_9DIPT|nr:Replicase polyprotein 1ab [Pseudolycoriella hygida]